LTNKALLTEYKQLATELLARQKAKESLIDFVTYTKPDFEVGEHHFQIANALEKVERGEIDRLMIFAPPRHTKSELSSRRFVAWHMGRNPTHQIISATYSGELANMFGYDVRAVMQSQEYANVFENVTLAPDSKAVGTWRTNHYGVYVSVGVGGAITGKGAHIALIDDPVKNREEADSQVIRDKTWNWYKSTLYTRLMPKGAIIVILTRWHEDDLAGRLLQEQEHGGDQWHIVNLPAINKAGAALWPKWYPIEALQRIKSAVQGREWSALYMQNPTPEEGDFFRRQWFKRYDKLPAKLNYYMASDYAVSDDGGDFTEHGIIGLDSDENLYIVDWWHGQESANSWIESGIDLVLKYKPFGWFGESGVIRRAIEPYLEKRINDRKAYVRMEWITRGHSKSVTARAFQAMAERGKVFFPKSSWGDRIIEQLIAFPAAKHDDAVDVLALFGMAVDQQHPAIKSVQLASKDYDPWEKAFEDEGADTWRVA
jgi:predicted phage terminase large subunit-like protein